MVCIVSYDVTFLCLKECLQHSSIGFSLLHYVVKIEKKVYQINIPCQSYSISRVPSSLILCQSCHTAALVTKYHLILVLGHPEVVERFPFHFGLVL